MRFNLPGSEYVSLWENVFNLFESTTFRLRETEEYMNKGGKIERLFIVYFRNWLSFILVSTYAENEVSLPGDVV